MSVEEYVDFTKFRKGWLYRSSSGYIYVVIKTTAKTVVFDKYDLGLLTVKRIRRKMHTDSANPYFRDEDCEYAVTPGKFSPPETFCSWIETIRSYAFTRVA